MISLVEAKNFRCLRHVRQPLGPFHVLVGPNASGKTTFLDVVAFLGDVVSEGLDAAIERRTSNFQDLIWERTGDSFELAVEATIPETLRGQLRDPTSDTVRYEIALTLVDHDTLEVGISSERVLLRKSEESYSSPQMEFPVCRDVPETIITPAYTKGVQSVVTKAPGENDNFYSEVYKEGGKGWVSSYRLGPRKSALGNLPEDETEFPVATWLKQFLGDNVQRFVLNSNLIRKASPPGRPRRFVPDGSNLPWVISRLESEFPERLDEWVAHLQTALPDLSGIRTVERKDDRHRYLVLRYRDGLEVPSWVVSDGTLRLLALTLPAYLPAMEGAYLIEEPENGIHPRAVATMFQSLTSVYGAQILLATHSPVILGMVEPEKVLCFAKTERGETDVVLGSQHPALRDWQHQTNLGVLFAAGVLG